MFRYGIKVLDVKHGYKSYLAIKQLCKLNINEVKDGVSKGEVLPIWEFTDRDLGKLKLWQAKMQTDMRALQDAGVAYDSYVYHDELGWQPITQLDSLLIKDTGSLQFAIERDQQATAALKRYQLKDNPEQALDELISLMPDDMHEVLYETGASPSFNTRLNRMLPSLDTAETRMLAYELDSHVRRQSLNLGAGSFFSSTPEPTPAAPIETEYRVVEETVASVVEVPSVDITSSTLVDNPSTPITATLESTSVTMNTPTFDTAVHADTSATSTSAAALGLAGAAATVATASTTTSSTSTTVGSSTTTRTTTVYENEPTPKMPWWILIVIALLLGFVWVMS